jgi:hypothetical protein
MWVCGVRLPQRQFSKSSYIYNHLPSLDPGWCGGSLMWKLRALARGGVAVSQPCAGCQWFRGGSLGVATSIHAFVFFFLIISPSARNPPSQTPSLNHAHAPWAFCRSKKLHLACHRISSSLARNDAMSVWALLPFPSASSNAQA